MATYRGFLPPDSDGNAKIKPEFIIIKHKQDVVKQESLPQSEAEKEKGKPKKRVRGQNKNRPRPTREDIANKLCPSMITKSRVCVYGDKCKYMHDVDAFMKVKPKDIGTECVSFRRKGLCPYSFACRFGSEHITHSDEKGYENIINEELKSKNLLAVTNVLSREMQLNLRKRKIDFSKTNDALKVIEERKRIKIANSETANAQDKQKQNDSSVSKNGDSNTNSTDKLSEEKSDETKTENGTVHSEISNDKKDSNVEHSCKGENITELNDSNSEKEPVSKESDITNKSLTQSESASDSDLTQQVNIQNVSPTTIGCLTDEDIVSLRLDEKKKIDFSNKLYLAPLTTCGNLPFRVVCKRLGADVTCGEMALSTNVLQGQTSEWALIKRHECEDIFGVQLCGAFPDTMGRCAELLDKHCEIDFIDVNIGCPIDLVFNKGAGSALMRRTNKLFDIITTMNRVISVPLTCKLRTGIETSKSTAHNVMTMMRDNGVALATLHGRSREARYTRIADWQYIDYCAREASPMPVFGNGDIFSYHDYYSALENTSISGIMIARGALIKPWLFTEIKEKRDWDISSTERFDIMKGFVNEGLIHWGSDSRGIEITRRFLLEWCSFLHRYIPLGILERIPQRINERPPYYVGRNDLETLMASPNANDWVKLSEMLLGPVPDTFTFMPKHRANAYK